VATTAAASQGSLHGAIARQIWRLASSRTAVCAVGVLLLQRVGVATLDAAAVPFYMRLPQARQSHFTLLAAIHFPIGIPSAILAARAMASRSSSEPLLVASTRLMRRAHMLLLLCAATCPLALLTHRVDSVARNVFLVALSCLFVGVNKLWWTALSTAFNALALDEPDAAGARATYLALLSSVSMAGKLWPTPLALLATDRLGFGAASGAFLCAGCLAAPFVDTALRQLACTRVPLQPGKPSHGLAAAEAAPARQSPHKAVNGTRAGAPTPIATTAVPAVPAVSLTPCTADAALPDAKAVTPSTRKLRSSGRGDSGRRTYDRLAEE
jgi:hypothetical protein